MLSAEMKKQICGATMIGCPLEAAARIVGESLGEVVRAIERDPAFAHSLRLAQARPEMTQLQNLFAAAEDGKNWRVSTWLLERLYPERYVRRKPGIVTAEQMEALLGEFADAIADLVDDDEARESIFDCLGDAIARLHDESIDEQPDFDRPSRPSIFDPDEEFDPDEN
jgi:hypothetical protein